MKKIIIYLFSKKKPVENILWHKKILFLFWGHATDCNKKNRITNLKREIKYITNEAHLIRLIQIKSLQKLTKQKYNQKLTNHSRFFLQHITPRYIELKKRNIYIYLGAGALIKKIPFWSFHPIYRNCWKIPVKPKLSEERIHRVGRIYIPQETVLFFTIRGLLRVFQTFYPLSMKKRENRKESHRDTDDRKDLEQTIFFLR